MTFTENAKMVEPREICEMIEDSLENAVVNGMLFIETRAKGDTPSKVFPCYPVAWKEEEKEDGSTQLAFKVDIIQLVSGEFGIIQVVVHEDEIGITKRFWNKPPTKGLRDEHPFVEEIVQ